MPRGSALIVNSGSSNVKFALFDLADGPRELRRGTLVGADGGPLIERLLDTVGSDLRTTPLAAIGHRVVHGGPRYWHPSLIDDGLLDNLRTMTAFAPNHLPAAVALIEAARAARPDVPHVACFDTGFYADLPAVSRRLPLPGEYDARGVRRYGFHGLAYSSVLLELRRRGAPVDARVILAHLGGGSSMTAMQGGRPIDTSMGMTPLGGLVMSTRSGDLDPGVVTYLQRTSAMTADQLQDLLSHAAGLEAISGTTGDMQKLLTAEVDDQDARLAVQIFCYQATKLLGAYAAALGGVDLIAFSGGIGEHSPVVRERICERLAFIGLSLDPARNAQDAPTISAEQSQVAVHVVAADEQRVIARAIHDLLLG